MSDAKQLDGHCLCGAVRVRIAAPAPVIEACHCSMCRRWGGGPLLSLRLVTDPQIDGAEHIVRYHSSDWAERGFCRNCGTHLFYYYAPKDGYSFGAGLFEGVDAFPLTEEIFVDEQPAGYAFAGDHERLTGAEVMAKAGIATS
ncbi:MULTISPECIES: GFA family protein [unclassified Sphingomonas]|uniref:GFA family protein n=1 Tax=unclassified Sphingomonas TaxID=196159 RepID=UPI002150890C|nr:MULTISPECIES: GFA family protein [unclassified Sphingomonas]MCR5870396.1 GFA family protein [Sphingomonas sp. J344]UUY01265.1 GFA family protein [Sphingomonas sp. J315]